MSRVGQVNALKRYGARIILLLYSSITGQLIGITFRTGLSPEEIFHSIFIVGSDLFTGSYKKTLRCVISYIIYFYSTIGIHIQVQESVDKRLPEVHLVRLCIGIEVKSCGITLRGSLTLHFSKPVFKQIHTGICRGKSLFTAPFRIPYHESSARSIEQRHPEKDNNTHGHDHQDHSLASVI